MTLRNLIGSWFFVNPKTGLLHGNVSAQRIRQYSHTHMMKFIWDDQHGIRWSLLFRSECSKITVYNFCTLIRFMEPLLCAMGGRQASGPQITSPIEFAALHFIQIASKPHFFSLLNIFFMLKCFVMTNTVLIQLFGDVMVSIKTWT